MKIWLAALLLVIGIWYIATPRNSIKNAGQRVSVIVAFGNSLTAGQGTQNPNTNSYPAVLAKLTNRTVINEGLSGDTAVEAVSRLPRVLAHRPQMVLIELGANDFLRNHSRPAAVAAVGQIVDAVQQAGAIAVVIDAGGPGMADYTKDFKKLAQKKGAVFVPSILADIFNRRDHMSDMVHPNAAGYAKVAERVNKYIEPYLK